MAQPVGDRRSSRDRRGFARDIALYADRLASVFADCLDLFFRCAEIDIDASHLRAHVGKQLANRAAEATLLPL